MSLRSLLLRRRRLSLAEAYARPVTPGGVTMALYFGLYVNGSQIGYFEAKRKEQAIPADRVCHYDVTVVHNGMERKASDVAHFYDDGAFTLVWRGLGEILRKDSTL